jgi:hypothetical protein
VIVPKIDIAVDLRASRAAFVMAATGWENRRMPTMNEFNAALPIAQA